jgi:hypothetical protein
LIKNGIKSDEALLKEIIGEIKETEIIDKLIVNYSLKILSEYLTKEWYDNLLTHLKYFIFNFFSIIIEPITIESKKVKNFSIKN